MPISDFSTIGGRPVYHGSVGCQASMALYGGAPFAPFYGIVSIAIVHDPALPKERRYPCPDTDINSVTPSRSPATTPSEGKENDGWHHGIPFGPNSCSRLFLGTAGTDLANILLHRSVYIVTFQGF